MKLHVGTVLALTLGLSACAGGNTPKDAAAGTTAKTAEQVLTAAPEGSRWRLVASTLAGLEAGGDSGIRIEFADGRLAGDSGCNRFSAPLQFDGESLKLGNAISSKRACLDGRGAAEAALYEALPGLGRAVQVGDQLRLEHASGGYMLFETDPTVAE